MSKPRRLRPLRQPAFWNRVDADGDCWEWTGGLHPGGYGVVDIGPRHMLAHRFAFEQLVGAVPAGLELDHLCRNRRCVNPDHLQAVTHTTNVRRGLAGIVNGSRERSKTHCKFGHPYDDANTYVKATGARGCRTCHRDRNRRRYRVAAGLPI